MHVLINEIGNGAADEHLGYEVDSGSFSEQDGDLHIVQHRDGSVTTTKAKAADPMKAEAVQAEAAPVSILDYLHSAYVDRVHEAYEMFWDHHDLAEHIDLFFPICAGATPAPTPVLVPYVHPDEPPDSPPLLPRWIRVCDLYIPPLERDADAVRARNLAEFMLGFPFEPL